MMWKHKANKPFHPQGALVMVLYHTNSDPTAESNEINFSNLRVDLEKATKSIMSI